MVREDANGIERPIQYISKQLNAAQRKRSAIEREAYAIVFALRKLQPYLHGAVFTVYTDHKPLKSLFQCEVKNTRVQRWAMLISEFGCDIEYRKGKNNVRADMLSRIKTEEVASVEAVIRESSFGEEQKQEFPAEWDNAETEEGDECVILNGELYSIEPPFMGAVPRPRLLIPSSKRKQLISEAHEEVGHRSLFATLRRLQAYAVWPGMRTEVKRAIGLCVHCRGNQRPREKSRYEITETPNQPFERIGIDLTGPFHPSPQGNRMLLTAIDHLTGWAEAIPIKNKSAVSVWDALYREIFPRWGMPAVVITDRGQEFNSSEIRRHFRECGIKQIRTTPYHPQSNGVCERFNQTLKATIRRLVNNDIGAWEDRLAEALMAYRLSEGQSRGTSPYQALYGREPNITTTNNGEGRLEHLVRVRRLVHESQQRAKESRAERGPQGPQDLRVGDYVTVNCPEPVTLTHLRDGALRIVALNGKVAGVVPINLEAGRAPPPTKYLSVDRLRPVPADVTWEELNPRVRRNRGPVDARVTVREPTAQTGSLPITEPQPSTQVTRQVQQQGRPQAVTPVAITAPTSAAQAGTVPAVSTTPVTTGDLPQPGSLTTQTHFPPRRTTLRPPQRYGFESDSDSECETNSKRMRIAFFACRRLQSHS